MSGGSLLLRLTGKRRFSINHAAKQLGVSRGALYELVRRDEIRHLAIGRRKLITRDALKEFIEANSRLGIDAQRLLSGTSVHVDDRQLLIALDERLSGNKLLGGERPVGKDFSVNAQAD